MSVAPQSADFGHGQILHRRVSQRSTRCCREGSQSRSGLWSHIGKAGWQDWNLTRFALENDYIFVTNNRRDFLKEYAAQGIHNGLIVIVPNVEREDQKRLFSAVLDHLAEMNDLPLNTLIEILEDGSIHQREWFDGRFEADHIDGPEW